MKTRLLIIDEQTATREMLVRILTTGCDFEIVAECDGGERALETCGRTRPDMAILDLSSSLFCGDELLRRLRGEYPRLRVLVFTCTRNRPQLTNAFRLRPHGIVDKRDSLQTLLSALRAVALGERYYSKFALRCRPGPCESARSHLTRRELEVLRLVADSCRTKEIASRLGVSPKTVENHRAHIMEKLAVHDTAALTRYAVRIGLLSQ